MMFFMDSIGEGMHQLKYEAPMIRVDKISEQKKWSTFRMTSDLMISSTTALIEAIAPLVGVHSYYLLVKTQ